VAGNMEAIDTATGANLAVIPFGRDAVFALAAAPNGHTVYALHLGDYPCCADPGSSPPTNSLTAIDASTLQIGASFHIGHALLALGATANLISITADSQTAYVFAGAAIDQIHLADLSLAGQAVLETTPNCLSLSADGGTLAFLDNTFAVYFLDTAAMTPGEPVTVGEFASGVVLNPAGTVAYVFFNSIATTGGVAVIDASTLEIVTTLETGFVQDLRLSPDAQQIYPLLQDASAVETIPPGGGHPATLLHAAGQAVWIALSPDAQTLYSANSAGVWVASTSTGKVARKMLAGNYGAAVALSPDGKTLYAVVGTGVGNEETWALKIVDTSTGVVQKTIGFPAAAYGYVYGTAIAVSPAGDRVYAMGNSPAIVIDGKTWTELAVITGSGGAALAINPAGQTLYVSNNGGDTGGPAPDILVVSTATNQVIGTIPIPAYSIAFSPDGSQAYVATSQNNATGIAVVDTTSLAVTNFAPCNVSSEAGQAVAVTPDGSELYTGGFTGAGAQPFTSISYPGNVIDTETLQVTGQFPSWGPVLIR
jgi:DNA-binding beta-propeller fold protein YncE